MQITPPLIAVAPRPWLSRMSGECAFPVDGEDAFVRACCNPAGPSGYCDAHAAIMRRPAVLDPVAYETAVLAWLEGRR
jgi:hypothetical protein